MGYTIDGRTVPVSYKANAGPLPREGSVPYPVKTPTASAMDLLPRRLKPGEGPFKWPIQKVATPTATPMYGKDSDHVQSLKIILNQAESAYKDLSVYASDPGMSMAMNKLGMLVNTIKKELSLAT